MKMLYRYLKNIIVFVMIMIINCINGKDKYYASINNSNKMVPVNELNISQKDFNQRAKIVVSEDLKILNTSEMNFGVIRAIRVDDSGNIYVADAKMGNIKVFNSEGKHINNIGKKGQGPGEFNIISDLYVLDDKYIVVFDIGNNRISYFSKDGKILKEISTAKIAPIIRIIPLKNEKYVMMKFIFDKVPTLKIDTYDDKLNKLFNIASINRNIAKDEYEFFTPDFRFAVFDDMIIWAITNKYKFIYVNSNNDIIQTININKKTRILTSNDKSKLIKETFENQPVPPKLIYPESYPNINHFGISDKGIIYIHTYEQDENNNYSYDIIDVKNNLYFEQILNIMPREWKNDRIYTIEDDDNNYQIIKRYRVKIEMK